MIIMVHDFDITLKFTKEDIERIKLGDRIAVYNMFGCKHHGLEMVHSHNCSGCQYLYKIDIRVPYSCGCYVKDYIKQVKRQLESK
jgi:hypothetical protein